MAEVVIVVRNVQMCVLDFERSQDNLLVIDVLFQIFK